MKVRKEQNHPTLPTYIYFFSYFLILIDVSSIQFMFPTERQIYFYLMVIVSFHEVNCSCVGNNNHSNKYTFLLSEVWNVSTQRPVPWEQWLGNRVAADRQILTGKKSKKTKTSKSV